MADSSGFISHNMQQMDEEEDQSSVNVSKMEVELQIHLKIYDNFWLNIWVTVKQSYVCWKKEINPQNINFNEYVWYN